MARRSSSSSSHRSSAGRRPEPLTEVHCPDCGTSYRLPGEQLAHKVQCRQCKRIFVPGNILRKKTRRSSGLGFRLSTAVTFALAVVLIVGGAVLLNHYFGPKPEPKPPPRSRPTGPSPEEIALRAAPIQALHRWVHCVQTADLITLDLLTDQGAFFDRLPDKERTKDQRGQPTTFRFLSPLEKIEWRERLFEDLTEGRLGAPIRGRQIDPSRTEITRGDPIVDGFIQITAALQKGGVEADTFMLSFDMARQGTLASPWWVVQRLTIEQTPRMEEGDLAATHPGSRKPPQPPQVPEGMQELQTSVSEDGRTAIHEHDIVPLAHLKETSQDLREEIDRLIGVLASLESRPRERERAGQRLREIGRPAFPRLLNMIHDIHEGPDPDSHHSISTMAHLIHTIIAPMTDCHYGFDPRPDADQAKRLQSLRRYFGWWFRHSSPRYWERLRERQDARSKEESL